ncbi:MAG TPA: hemolysin family protein [Candidatus Kapabacteria bacterium]|nr:hemolysin family protein [Candidatus Kapabacteria bacterium]
MTILAFSGLFLISMLFYMLEVSFKSFSRISLAGFLDDLDNPRLKKFDFVENYDMLLYSLAGLSFCLQMCLFIFSFSLLKEWLPGFAERLVLLIVAFLILFNFLLYTFSFSKKERILKSLLPLSRIAWILFYPFHVIFSVFIKKEPEEEMDDDEYDLSEKELEVFFEEGAKEGVLEKEDKEMIESVLEFGDTLVKEIITPRVDMIYVSIDTGLAELVEVINKHKRSRYPVISGRIDNVEGIILSKDVFNYWNHNDHEFHIRKILRKAFFVPETMRILELLKEMQKSKQKFAIVVDEFGGISGVVTMEDIIEEIVGEIHDEYDEDKQQIVEEKDYLVVKGDTDIFELSDRLKVDLEEDEDYQTVAGLMSYKLGKIPDKLDTVIIENYSFEVLEMEKNRVKKVKIVKQLQAE